MKRAIFAIVILAIIALVLVQNKTYQIKIEVRCDNYDARKMDEIIAEELKDNLSQIEELSEIYIISKENTTNIYCAIKPFVNKNRVVNKIEQRLELSKQKIDNSTKITLDSDFELNYQTLFVVYTDSTNYNVLKKYSDIVLDRLLGLKVSSKILTVSDIEKCVYVYFSDSDLVKYNLRLTDIKDFIIRNNILANSNSRTTPLNSYEITTNSSLEDVSDIKNLALNYLDKNFSNKLGDIFKIEETIKTPSPSYTYLDDKKAVIFAISKKKFYPDFLISYKLKKLQSSIDLPSYIKTKIFKTSKFQKIEVYFDNNTSILNTLNEYRKFKNTKDVLFFVGIDSPKRNHTDKFFEQQKNKLTILTPAKEQIDNILKNMTYINPHDKVIYFENTNLDKIYSDIKALSQPNINNSINKAKKIKYNIDDYALRDYLLDKHDVLDTIFALNDGLFCDYYYDINTQQVPVILKNIDDKKRGYIYSKELKNLIYLNSTTKSTFEEDYNIITRKNDKYFAKIIIK